MIVLEYRMKVYDSDDSFSGLLSLTLLHELLWEVSKCSALDAFLAKPFLLLKRPNKIQSSQLSVSSPGWSSTKLWYSYVSSCRPGTTNEKLQMLAKLSDLLVRCLKRNVKWMKLDEATVQPLVPSLGQALAVGLGKMLAQMNLQQGCVQE